MVDTHQRPRKLAVLIDADNASPRIAESLFGKVAAIGDASVRRIYGDFSGTRLKGWSDVLSAYAIVPNQNFANTTGKNASDIALVIDAMDLLHTGRFDGFCLVSSDSDFTKLAARIREQGADVYGFGERKTPESFRKACKHFVYTDGPLPVTKAVGGPATPDKPPMTAQTSPHQPLGAAAMHVRAVLRQLEDVNGWYFLGTIGNRLHALVPEFDPRTYGCANLVTLIERLEAFDIRREKLIVYVRPKDSALAR